MHYHQYNDHHLIYEYVFVWIPEVHWKMKNSSNVPFRTLNVTSEKQYISLDQLLKGDGDFYEVTRNCTGKDVALFPTPTPSYAWKEDTTFELLLLKSEMSFPIFSKILLTDAFKSASVLSNYINMSSAEWWVPTWSFRISNGAYMAAVMEYIINHC